MLLPSAHKLHPRTTNIPRNNGTIILTLQRKYLAQVLLLGFSNLPILDIQLKPERDSHEPSQREVDRRSIHNPKNHAPGHPLRILYCSSTVSKCVENLVPSPSRFIATATPPFAKPKRVLIQYSESRNLCQEMRF
jgi:hypothetical protein